MDETKVAYLAGFIDGDGTICITKNRGKYEPKVHISNTSMRSLEWCKDFIGPGGSISSKKKYKDHHTQSYVLKWAYNDAIRVATMCHPYLIIKRKRAECLMRWKSVTHRNGKYTKEAWKKKMDLINEMRRLNKEKEG